MNTVNPLYAGNRFMRLANAASELERRGDYLHAAKLWFRAALVPSHRHNHRWAEARADTCKHFAKRENQHEIE